LKDVRHPDLIWRVPRPTSTRSFVPLTIHRNGAAISFESFEPCETWTPNQAPAVTVHASTTFLYGRDCILSLQASDKDGSAVGKAGSTFGRDGTSGSFSWHLPRPHDEPLNLVFRGWRNRSCEFLVKPN
jgi:hypothetical protein